MDGPLSQARRCLHLAKNRLPAFIPVEVFMIAAFGSTLGKMIYGISIARKDQSVTRLPDALKRAYLVWVRGWCFGLPLFPLLALISAARDLKADGEMGIDCGVVCDDPRYYSIVATPCSCLQPRQARRRFLQSSARSWPNRFLGQTRLASHSRIAAVAIGLLSALPGFAACAATLTTSYKSDLGTTVSVLEGQIQPGDDVAIVNGLDRLRKDQPRFLVLDSPGGNLKAALAIGNWIRQNGVGTILLPRMSCYSACAFIFFAGFDRRTFAPKRIAFDGSSLGVHQVSFAERGTGDPAVRTDPTVALYAIQSSIAAEIEYLRRMGASLEIQEGFLATGPDKIFVVPRPIAAPLSVSISFVMPLVTALRFVSARIRKPCHHLSTMMPSVPVRKSSGAGGMHRVNSYRHQRSCPTGQVGRKKRAYSLCIASSARMNHAWREC
jgi:hypothetical protein